MTPLVLLSIEKSHTLVTASQLVRRFGQCWNPWLPLWLSKRFRGLQKFLWVLQNGFTLGEEACNCSYFQIRVCLLFVLFFCRFVFVKFLFEDENSHKSQAVHHNDLFKMYKSDFFSFSNHYKYVLHCQGYLGHLGCTKGPFLCMSMLVLECKNRLFRCPVIKAFVPLYMKDTVLVLLL